ncbi:hypothetical protein KR084_004866 [Drosophila pseudotakahashii]|nr:hypothetical protein KR084_004866 [Drosophila pseudotakahashii]
MKALIVLVALAWAAPAFTRIMDRCSLAREMFNLDVPRDQLSRWACFAEYESAYRTDLVGPGYNGYNGSSNYGIFQINESWCYSSSGRHTPNNCGVSCNDLLTDDITNSVRCAQKVHTVLGWSMWKAWYNGCNAATPTVEHCLQPFTPN